MELGLRDFLRAFMYSYVVTSAELLGNRAPVLRRSVCRNAARALLREHREMEEYDPVDLIREAAESLLGADPEVTEEDSGTVVEIKGCEICTRDLVKEFVERHPKLREAVFGYDVCPFVTTMEEVLRAMGRDDVKLEHDPIERSHCRVIIREEG
jgi:hypothetical protein